MSRDAAREFLELEGLLGVHVREDEAGSGR